MPKYGERLLQDMPQQFKGKPYIEAFLEVIGTQFDELLEFYDSLNCNRSLNTAQGVQLDRIGEILVLSRKEAGKLFNKAGTIDDDLYRRLLIYKVIMNFGSATYYDIMNCIKIIQGDTGFRYKEEASRPATIILESKESASSESVREMLKTPIPKAAGVGLRIRTFDESEFCFGTGFTSQIFIAKEIQMEEIDVEELLVYYIDELLDMLTDENGDILLSEESADTSQ